MWGEDEGEAYDLVVHVGEIASAVLSAEALIALLRERLGTPGESQEARRARLYLADGAERAFTIGRDE